MTVQNAVPEKRVLQGDAPADDTVEAEHVPPGAFWRQFLHAPDRTVVHSTRRRAGSAMHR
jgi:hypothetical protein